MRSRALIGATMVVGMVATANSPSLQDDAQRRLQAERFVARRARHRQLAEQHPARDAGTVWTARPAGWLHDSESAEAAFDAALSADPANVDALLGKAYLLSWHERDDEADALLVRARALAPERADVRLACARQAARAPSERRNGGRAFARLMRILTGRS